MHIDDAMAKCRGVDLDERRIRPRHRSGRRRVPGAPDLHGDRRAEKRMGASRGTSRRGATAFSSSLDDGAPAGSAS